MKKTLIIFPMLLTLLLCGCGSADSESADNIDYGDTFSKAQEIAVIDPDTKEVIETISDEDDVIDFTSALDASQWKLRSLPDNASKLGSFGFSQQKTIKLFDTTPDETLYDVGTITLYEGGYVGAAISGFDWLNMYFKVSDDTNDYLKAFFAG